jgi:hypothetical protein
MHATSFDDADFRSFLAESADCDLNVMFETRDRERSAFRAYTLVVGDSRRGTEPGSYP